jgi:hypothetical protein
MVRIRFKLLLRLWPIGLVVLNFMIFPCIVGEHRLQYKHLLNVVYDLLKRNFFVTSLLLVSLLVAPITLLFLLCL